MFKIAHLLFTTVLMWNFICCWVKEFDFSLLSFLHFLIQGNEDLELSCEKIAVEEKLKSPEISEQVPEGKDNLEIPNEPIVESQSILELS